jgi:hypothetical protein
MTSKYKHLVNEKKIENTDRYLRCLFFNAIGSDISIKSLKRKT